MLRPVHELLNDNSFLVAVAAGLILGALAWLFARRSRPILGYACVAVLATLAGYRVGHRLPAALVVGLALLALGDWISRRRRSWLVRTVVLVPGAVAVGVALPDGFGFRLGAAVALATLIAAPLVVVSARRDPRLVAVLFAVSAVGLYACVPDTEHARTLMGGLLAAGLLAADPELAMTPGVSALTGLFVWTAAFGGHGRTGSVVGGIACLGVLVLAPLAGWSRRRRAPRSVLLLTHVSYVAYVARVAGFRQTAWAAAALAVPATLAAWAVLVVTTRRDRRL
jgi:hypothetical protein